MHISEEKQPLAEAMDMMETAFKQACLYLYEHGSEPTVADLQQLDSFTEMLFLYHGAMQVIAQNMRRRWQE